jgi:hypothetical protein
MTRRALPRPTGVRDVVVSARGLAGLFGVGLIVVVGYRMSAQAEAADQLPGLAWGVVGLAIVVIASGAFGFAAALGARQRLHALEAKLATLHRHISSVAASAGATSGHLLATDDGETYHLDECRVLAGKVGARQVDQERVAARQLRPCALCGPPPPGELDATPRWTTEVVRS